MHTTAAVPRGRTRPPSRLRRVVQWLGPSAALVLVPKCPMCVAAYVAACTGMAISLQTAIYLRWSLILLCTLSLVALSTRKLVSLRKA